MKRIITMLILLSLIVPAESRETIGYEINIFLNRVPLDSFFDFYKDEEILCSIIHNAQAFVSTNMIESRHAAEAAYYLVIFMLSFLLIVTIALLFRSAQHKKNLDEIVKNRANELELQTATLLTIYESIPDLVFCKDIHNIYTSCNPSFEKFAGLTQHQIIGKNDFELFETREDMAQLFAENHNVALKSKNIEVVDQSIIYPDGSRRSVEIILRPLLQNEEVIGVIGIARDITERKAAGEAAQAASKAKRAFLANMSHELRTPLYAIIGMSNIVKNSMPAIDPEKTLASVNQIISSSQHLLNIINDALDMSKIESGKLTISNEPFSLVGAYDEVSGIITQRCFEKTINFTTNIKDMKDMILIGDKLRLNQVLINLMSNAIKFTSPGGKIKFMVHVLEEDDESIRISFSVSDNGIGMSKEQTAKLFVPFEQTDSSIAARFGGTGLGLSISQNLVNMMGGVIKVESVLNIGSRFFFDLRFQKCVLKQKNIYKVPEQMELKNKRILLVEDMDMNRFIILQILSSTGIAIDEAGDGQQAVDMYSHSDIGYYDLIYMDIRMPIVDGLRAAKAIRALNREDAKKVPIIAMSANAYQEEADQILAAGMNGCLSKPVYADALMKNLVTWIDWQ